MTHELIFFKYHKNQSRNNLFCVNVLSRAKVPNTIDPRLFMKVVNSLVLQ